MSVLPHSHPPAQLLALGLSPQPWSSWLLTAAPARSPHGSLCPPTSTPMALVASSCLCPLRALWDPSPSEGKAGDGAEARAVSGASPSSLPLVLSYEEGTLAPASWPE